MAEVVQGKLIVVLTPIMAAMNTNRNENNGKTLPGVGDADKGSEWYEMLKAKRTVWGIIILGGLARLFLYLSNPSLWGDEANLAVTLYQKAPGQLIKGSTPPGFMLLQKMVVEFLGGSEYALRLVPLLCSIISVVLFYHLVRRFCRPVIVPLAMMVFSVSSPLMFLAAEGQQYGVEVFLSIAALLVMLWVFDQKKLSIARTVGFSIFGAAVLWLSHGVVFILAGGRQCAWIKKYAGPTLGKNVKIGRCGVLLVREFSCFVSCLLAGYEQQYGINKLLEGSVRRGNDSFCPYAIEPSGLFPEYVHHARGLQTHLPGRVLFWGGSHHIMA